MTQSIIPLILFLFPLAYSPGPGNLFFAANGARFGFAATIPATVGYHTATWLVALAIGWGFRSVLAISPVAGTGLRIAGCAYVLWLSWKLFRSGVLSGEHEAIPASFRDGVVLLLLNPKAYVIMVLVFTQFLNVAGDVFWVATVFTLNNLIAFSVWTLLGDVLARRFRNQTQARALNTALSAMLAIVAIWMLIA